MSKQETEGKVGNRGKSWTFGLTKKTLHGREFGTRRAEPHDEVKTKNEYAY